MSSKVERNTNFADIAETSPVLRDTGETLTPELLRQLLDYNPDTGVLVWKVRPRELFRREKDWKFWNRHYPGKVAGHLKTNGYYEVKVFCRQFKAHRLAWAIHYGEWPLTTDHINGDKSDNRLANLRSVSHAENMKNRVRHANNTTGLAGVTLQKASGKYVAQITYRGRRMNLGSFDDKEAAHAAWLEAKARFGYAENHGRAA